MDKKAMEELYLEHGKIVYGYLLKLTHNQLLSEEFAQETFYQAICSMDRYKGSCKISSWLCQIAKNIWLNYQRKEKKIEYTDELEHFCGAEQTFDHDIIKEEEKLLLYKILHRLPAHMREVIYLRITGEFTFKEIGEILGKSEVWARTNYYRGKKKIAEEVEKSES